MKKKQQSENLIQHDYDHRFRQFFDSGRIGFSRLDSGLTFLDVNLSFCNMLGYKEDELRGMLLSEITHPDFIEEDISMSNALKDGIYPIYRTEKQFIRKDGSTCWGAITATVIRDDNNDFSYYLNIIDDITSQKEFAEKAEHLQDKLHKISNCLATLGTNHNDNINTLTALCGTLLNATCALYNRLDDGVLCSIGQWQTPANYASKDNPDGHICYDVIKNNHDDSLIINNLPDTSYAKTDPNVLAYELKTYCGHVVRCEGKAVGSLCVVYQSDYNITEDDLKILGIISAAIGNEDLRMHYNQALNKSEHILVETEKISHTGGWEYSVDTDELAWTNEMYSIYGLRDTNLRVDLNLAIGVFDKDDQALIRNLFQNALDNGKGWDIELRMISKDKIEKWVRTIGRATYEGGTVVKVSGNLIDITDRKASEFELLARNEEQRLLAELSDKLISFKSEDEVYNFICEQIYKLISPGYLLLTSYDQPSDTVRLKKMYGVGKLIDTIKNSIGIDPFTYTTKLADLDQNDFGAFKQHKLTQHANDCLYTVSAHTISKKAGKAIETLLGIKCAYSIGFSNEGSVYGGIVILSKADTPFQHPDLVETLVSQASIAIQRLLAERKLQIERDNLQSILSSSPVGMIILNEEQSIVNANQAAANLFKVDLQSMKNMRCGDFLGCINRSQNTLGCGHSTECPACNIMVSIEKALRTKEKIHDQESELIQDLPSGPVSIWFRFSIEPIDLNGEFHLIMALYDITERKKADLLLQKTHDYYHKIIEHAPDGIVLVSMEGKFLYVSSSARKMFGYDDGDLEKFMPDQLTHPDDLPMVLSVLGQLIMNPVLIPVVQYRFLAKSGEYRWIESTFSNLIQEPSVGAIVINFRDIHERKKAELELTESELKYKIVANNTYDWEFWQAADGNYIYHSPSCKRITGYAAETFLSDKNLMLNIIHPEDTNIFLDHKKLEPIAGVHSSIEFRIIDKNNTIRYIEHLCQPVYDINGTYLGIRGSNREVTERKQVELALHNSESRFRSLIENSADAIIIIDKDAQIQYESPAYSRISGRNIEDRIGKSGLEFIHPEDLPSVRQALEKIKNKPDELIHLSFRNSDKDNCWHWLDCVATNLLDDPVIHGIVVNMHDITSRKLAEDALRESESKYRGLFDANRDGISIFYVNPDNSLGQFVEVNEAAARMIGLSREEFLNYSVMELEEGVTPFVAQEREYKIRTQGFVNTETLIRHKDGHKIDVELLIIPIEFNSRMALMNIVRDISERKTAERALRESEERWAFAIEGSNDGIWDWNIREDKIYYSNRWKEMLGFQPEEISEDMKTFGQFVHPDDYDRVMLEAERYLKHEIPEYRIEHRMLCKNGDYKWILDRGKVLVYDEEGNPLRMVGTHSDITDQKKTELALRLSEEKYRRLTDNAVDIIFRLEVEPVLQMSYISPSLKAILGIEPAEFLQSSDNFIEAIYPDDRKFFLDLVDARVIPPEPILMRWNVKTGGFKWLESRIVPIFDENNRPIAVEGISRDITQDKLAREALNESETRFRSVFEGSPDAIFLADIETGFLVDVNSAACNLLGKSAGELIGMHQSQLHPTIHRDFSIRTFQEKSILPVNDIKLKPTVNLVQCADGSQVPVEILASIINLNGRKVMHGVFRDITDRKKAEDSLKESEDKFRTLAESSPYAIMIYQNNVWVYSNPAGERICGYSIDELYSMHFWSIVAPEYRDSIQKIGIKRQKGNSPDASYEFRIITKSGKTKWVFLTGSSLIYNGSPAGIISAVDITDRKMAEEEVQAERILLRTLIDNLPDTVYVKDLEARKVLANKADLRIMGFKSELEVIGKTDMELLDPAIGKKCYDDDLQLLKSGKPIFNREEDFTDIDGKLHWLLTSKIPLFNDSGQVNGMIGIGRDITERKLGEMALHESELRYRSLFNEMLEGFALHEIICDRKNRPVDYRFLNVNPAFERMTNLSAKSIVGKRVKEVLPGIEDTWIKNYGKVALTGNAMSFEDYSADLERYYYVVAFSPDKGKFATVITDITDRKIAEEEVRKLNADLEERVKIRTMELESAVQEMEAFSYSVSHDLRSPLRAISGFSRILQDDYAQLLDAEGLRVLGVIRNNTQKMDQLITDLLSLSRISRFELKSIEVNMNTLVQSTIKELIQSDEPSVIQFNVPELQKASCDPNLIRQVWMNLISNAIKYTRSQPSRMIEVGSYTDGGMIVYYVKDNGVGFNPSYTHKLFGVFQRLHKATDFEGTGVGLAIVKRIITRHNGHTWAEGAIDKGATFYFSLPEVK